MNTVLHISLIVAVLIYFIVLFMMLRKNKLSLKYSLLWMLTGVIMAVFVIFPGLLDVIAGFFGVHTPTNALFAILIFCLIILLISLTSIVSAQTKRITTLIQEVAVNDKAIRELEKKVFEGKI